MSLKNFVKDHKAVLLLGAGVAYVAGMFLYFQVNKTRHRQVDPSVKNVPLYDRLGGDFAVEALVSRFIDRMAGDKILKKYFINANIKDQKTKLTIFLTQQFDAPNTKKDISIKGVLTQMKISNDDFNIALVHFEQTAYELAVDTAEINDAKAVLEKFRNDIVAPV